jgi:hypothetical protein
MFFLVRHNTSPRVFIDEGIFDIFTKFPFYPWFLNYTQNHSSDLTRALQLFYRLKTTFTVVATSMMGFVFFYNKHI